MAITPETPGEIQPPNTLTPDDAGSIGTPNSIPAEAAGAVGVPNTLTPDSIGAIGTPNALNANPAGNISLPNNLGAESAGSIGTPNSLNNSPTPISELVTNGDFANGADDWASRNGATLSVTSNVMEVTDATGSGGSAAIQDVALIAGKTYVISCEARTVIGVNAELLIEWSGGGDIQGTGTASASFVPLSMEFTPLNTTGDSGNIYRINLRESGSDIGDICEFKNVSIKVRTLITAEPAGSVSVPNTLTPDAAGDVLPPTNLIPSGKAFLLTSASEFLLTADSEFILMET